MKSAVLVVATALFIGSIGLALAQSATPTDGHMSRPVNNEVSARMMTMMEQIQKDLHAGKLTQAQATALKAKVLTVRQQELQDFKTNGHKYLTADQKTELGQALDAIQPSV
jgi:hypothetical protein